MYLFNYFQFSSASAGMFVWVRFQFPHKSSRAAHQSRANLHANAVRLEAERARPELRVGLAVGRVEREREAEAYVENKVALAQTSASWTSGGSSQRQIMPQAAPSFGQPRPIRRLGLSVQPCRPCFPHRLRPVMAVGSSVSP